MVRVFLVLLMVLKFQSCRPQYFLVPKMPKIYFAIFHKLLNYTLALAVVFVSEIRHIRALELQFGNTDLNITLALINLKLQNLYQILDQALI